MADGLLGLLADSSSGEVLPNPDSIANRNVSPSEANLTPLAIDLLFIAASCWPLGRAPRPQVDDHYVRMPSVVLVGSCMWIFAPSCRRTGQALVVFLLPASVVFCDISRFSLPLCLSFVSSFSYQPLSLITWTHFRWLLCPEVVWLSDVAKSIAFCFLSSAELTCLVQCVYVHG